MEVLIQGFLLVCELRLALPPSETKRMYLIPFNFRLPLISASFNFRPFNFRPPRPKMAYFAKHFNTNSQIRSLFISLPLNFKDLKSAPSNFRPPRGEN